MLPKPERLTTKEILTLSQGRSVFGTLISMRFTDASKTKFAVSVSKKIASRAVDRNRIRRRVYAIVENVKSLVKKPSFIMLMPKKECLTAPTKAVEDDIIILFGKAFK